MKRLAAALRSRVTRTVFVVVSLCLAALVLWRDWSAVSEALAAMPKHLGLAAVLASFVNVLLAASAWRAVAVDLGARISLLAGWRIFLVGQLGKYVPGSVWQFVASTEVGVDLGVPRRITASSLLVSMLVSIATGLSVGLSALPFVRADLGGSVALAALAVVPLGVLLHPRVLVVLLNRILRAAKRTELDQGTTHTGTAIAAGLAALAWLFMGAQVFALSVALGASATVSTFALSTGGFALAWVAGFVSVFAPAGVGVREVVLAAVLAGVLAGPELLVLVLLSRLLITMADVSLALTAAIASRRRSGPELTGQ